MSLCIHYRLINCSHLTVSMAENDTENYYVSHMALLYRAIPQTR